MIDLHSQAGRAACLPCRAEGSQGPAAGIPQEHPLLQGQDIWAVSLRTAQSVPERKEGQDFHFMPPAQPHLPCAPLRDGSAPLAPSEVHMYTVAGKNTPGKVSISREFS